MSAPAHIARENGKKGGRPPGKRNQKTLEKEAMLRAYEQRVMKLTDKLMNAQLTLAFGQTFLYKIEKIVTGTGKNKKVIPKKPVRVTNEWEIEAFLEREIEGGELEDRETTYYFLTTKEPDGQTIDSMLKRTYGTPKHTVVTEDGDGKQMPIGSINIVPLDEQPGR